VARKLKPSHSLSAIKAAALSGTEFNLRQTPIDDANELGFSVEDMLEVVDALDKSNFKKTMKSTDFPDETIDVYNIFWEGFDLYLEFSRWPQGSFKLIAFHIE
jgi:hypothetical protein